MFSKNVSESLSSPTKDYTGVSKLPIKMLMCWKVNYFTLTRERYFQHSKIQIYRTLNTPYLPTKCLNLRRVKCILLQTSFPGLFPIFLGEKLKPWEQGGYLCRPNHSLLADLNKTNQQKTSIQRLGRNLNNCYHSASGPSVRRHFFMSGSSRQTTNNYNKMSQT